VVAVLAVAGCGSTSSTPARLTARDIVQRSTDAIVIVEAGSEKVGTGFVVDRGGIIATNLHVVAGETVIKIKLHDGSQYAVKQVAGMDLPRDLALLRIEPRQPLPVLKLGDSDAAAAGDPVIAIGNQLGVFDYSVTSGLISQVRHGSDITVLQISAAISLGSSGGPLFNQAGEVIGVTTAIITAGQNLNLAVPANYLKPLVAQRQLISLESFARQTKSAEEAVRRNHRGGDEDDGVQIERKIPSLDTAVYDGCNIDDIGEVVQQISEAIENGAPLYNQGQVEACFRIYEGTAIKFEHDAKCAGVRTAFNDGLSRAGSLRTYKEKAWAMRDTFDGLIDAARRWADKHPNGKSATPKKRAPKP